MYYKITTKLKKSELVRLKNISKSAKYILENLLEISLGSNFKRKKIKGVLIKGLSFPL